MFIDYTSDFDRTVSVLRDFLKKCHFDKWNTEKKEFEVVRNYEEVKPDSYHLKKTPDYYDPEHQQGYFAIDKENKKIIIRITDTYYLRLTFELEDQDRIDYPEQYEINGGVEYGIDMPERRTVYSVEQIKPAHAVVNKKLVHYELRGYNGDEDFIEIYFPCKCVEQKQYIIKTKVMQGLETNIYTFTELPWNLQVSSIVKDIKVAMRMNLKDWVRHSEVDNYDRKFL